MSKFKHQQIETCKRYIINESLFGQQQEQLKEMMIEMDVELNVDFNHCFLILTGIEKRFYNKKLGMDREQYLEVFAAANETMRKLSQEYTFMIEMSAVNYDSSKLIAILITPCTKQHLPISVIAEKIQNVLQQEFFCHQVQKNAYLCNVTFYSPPITSYVQFQSEFKTLRNLHKLAFYRQQPKAMSQIEFLSVQQPAKLMELIHLVQKLQQALIDKKAESVHFFLHEIIFYLKKSMDVIMTYDIISELKKMLLILNMQFRLDYEQTINDVLKLEQYCTIEEFEAALLKCLFTFCDMKPKENMPISALTLSVIQYISQHYQKTIGLAEIAKALDVSPSYLSRVFNAEMQISITQFINEQRIRKAKQLLCETNLKIGVIAESCGISNVQYFCMKFKQMTAMRPQEYRQKHSQ